MLLGEQRRALDLLHREKAASVALAATAEEKLRRAEAELQVRLLLGFTG